MEKKISLKLTLQSSLNTFLDLCHCDGGSIYTIESKGQGRSVLKFKALITRSQGIFEVPEELRQREFEIDSTTVVGRTALERVFVHEKFPAVSAGTESNRVEVLKYCTLNLLSGPLITPRGELVGVVQLLNKLPTSVDAKNERSEEVGFDSRDEQVFTVIASQAALSIENSLLLDEQEKLIEGVVDAFVVAIDARDPATAGHSNRVADLCVDLAGAVNRDSVYARQGVLLSATEIRELRFAAMLHDVGKVSVSELILNKSKKMHVWELQYLALKVEYFRARLSQELALQPTLELQRQLRLVEQAWGELERANEPTVLEKETSGALEALRSLELQTSRGELLRLLSEDEFARLSISRGSLSAEERAIMERHVVHTYEILKRVPWSRDLSKVPSYAFCHHERLDGSGYPLKVKAEAIPLQGRLMAICDIYDALAASDRPYKQALPPERALAIIEKEVNQGKLDAELFRCFVEARVYERVGAALSQARQKAA